MSFLEVQNLTKSFSGTKVLKGLSFSLEKGQALAVVGSSGNGKTTLLRILCSLDSADAGRVVLDGRELWCAVPENGGTSRKKRAKSGAKPPEGEPDFGLVFQSFELFPQYTALNNITLAAESRLKKRLKSAGIKGKEFRRKFAGEKEKLTEKALAFLDDLGLKEKANAYPYELSGGQKQRVAICRALMLSPRVLCFDEPTSALDPQLTQEVLCVIRQLAAEKRTMIVVTHEMNFARDVADRVIYMENGLVAEDGPAKEVLGSARSAAIRAFAGECGD